MRACEGIYIIPSMYDWKIYHLSIYTNFALYRAVSKRQELATAHLPASVERLRLSNVVIFSAKGKCQPLTRTIHQEICNTSDTRIIIHSKEKKSSRLSRRDGGTNTMESCPIADQRCK